jgi:hypothetical protein
MQSAANLSLKDSIVQNKSLRTILTFLKNLLLKSIMICERIYSKIATSKPLSFLVYTIILFLPFDMIFFFKIWYFQ